MILGRLSVVLFSILVAFGPSAIFGGSYWINSFGSTGYEEGKDIVVDDNYVYVIGTFQGTVDFDAGSGTTVTNLTATGTYDAYLAKYNLSGGDILWVKSLGIVNGGGKGYDISVDASGNIYAAGTIYTSSSASEYDFKFFKYDTNGNLLWSKTLSADNIIDEANITFDSSGNVYVSGTLTHGNMDVDTGSGTITLDAEGDRGIFFAKYDSNGAYVWVKLIHGGNSDPWVTSIAVDGSNNLFLCGWFDDGTVDFDPGTGTSNLTSAGGNDVFIAKYNSDGELTWVKSMGSTSYDNGYALALDNSGNLYVAGSFTNTVDFDPGSGTMNLIGNGNPDIFFAKYNSDGNFVWAKGIGSEQSENPHSITVDSNNNVYLTGEFQSTLDFDPGSGTTNLTSNGSNDIFFAKYNSSGEYIWAKSIGGTSSEYAYSIAVDSNSNIYLTGKYEETVDFDPSSNAVHFTSNGGQDSFIAKYDSNGDLPGSSKHTVRHSTDPGNSDFTSIQSAINASFSGDTIFVYSGAFGPYSEHLTITDKIVTILSEHGPSSTTIDGGGTGRPVTITGTSAVTMKGFSITNGLSEDGGGINISSTGGVLLENLYIYSNQATDEGGGIYTSENSNVTINSCKVYSNVCVSEGGGIINWDSLIVQNSLIYENESQTDGGGISSRAPLILINSTLAYNFIPDGRYGPALTIHTALDSLLLFNNIFYQNYRWIASMAAANFDESSNLSNGRLVAYNNYFQSGDNNLTISRGSGNIFSDTSPLISETSASDDYSLQNTSNAIGAGISSVTLNGTTYSAPTTDFNGAARPQPVGTNPDMGAIENSLGVAAAKTIIVCGNLTGPECTSSNADYESILAAIFNASDGDNILVYPGSYAGMISINKAITLKSVNGPESTTIDAQGTGTVVTIGIPDGPLENNVNVTLDGFTLRNGLASGSNSKSGGLIVSVSNSIIKNCIIRDNQSHQGGGIYAEGGSFYNCVIINNTAEFEGGGVFLYDTGNGSAYYTTFTNCLIADNNCDIGAGIAWGPTTLINCTVVNNIGNYGLHSVGTSTITNSIIYDNDGIDLNSSTAIVTYSLIEGGYSGEGNIDLDPLLEYPQDPPMGSHSYTLQSSSPAIDAANPDLDGDGITWETDTDDQDPDGSRMDMGYISRSCQVDQCGVCDHDSSNDCVMDCAGVWGGDAELDCLGICEGGAILDDCGDCNGNNANMNECGVCYAQYSCNPFLLSNEKDTISLKTDTLTFTFSVPMDTLTFSAINLASTEIDNIEFHTSQDADSIRTLTLIINSPLVSRDTLTLTFPSTLQSSFGYPFDGNQDGTTGDGQTITLYTETLADYNHDNAIDFDDMTIFIASWYADDYDKELGPVTGTAPHLIPAFDNAFDIEDIITFMLMWNWANDFTPTPAARIKDSGIPPNIILQDGILQLDLSEYLDNIAAVRIQLSTSDPKVKVVSEGIQSPFGITLLRSWEEDNIYEWNFGNPQGKHFDVVQLCHLETMQKQNLHLVIDYEIISIHGNILSSGRTALDHIVIPNEYALHQAYPNPFNPVTTLSFGLPIETEVSLSVYNLQGKEVISLIDGNLDAGYHSVVWNADRHSSGVYFVKMIAGEYVNTQKLMLVK